MTTPQIVVIGGGAGGLELATRLGNKFGRKGKAAITLIDRNSNSYLETIVARSSNRHSGCGY